MIASESVGFQAINLIVFCDVFSLCVGVCRHVCVCDLVELLSCCNDLAVKVGFVCVCAFVCACVRPLAKRSP